MFDVVGKPYISSKIPLHSKKWPFTDMITSLFLTEYSESSQRDFFLNYEKPRLNASFSPGNAPTSTTFASQDAGSTASSEEDSDEADSSELLLVSLSESLSELLSCFRRRPKTTTTCPAGVQTTKRLAHWVVGNPAKNLYHPKRPFGLFGRLDFQGLYDETIHKQQHGLVGDLEILFRSSLIVGFF